MKNINENNEMIRKEMKNSNERNDNNINDNEIMKIIMKWWKMKRNEMKWKENEKMKY